MLTRSPLATPRSLRALAKRWTSACRSRVGDRPRITRLALPVDGDPVTVAAGDVAVDAVRRHVERAADEPLGVGQLPVEDRRPLLVPVEQLHRLRRPEPLVVRGRLVVQEGAGDEGVALDVLRGRERAVLGEQGVDRLDVLSASVGRCHADPPRLSSRGRAGRRRRGRPTLCGRRALRFVAPEQLNVHAGFRLEVEAAHDVVRRAVDTRARPDRPQRRESPTPRPATTPSRPGTSRRSLRRVVMPARRIPARRRR